MNQPTALFRPHGARPTRTMAALAFSALLASAGLGVQPAYAALPPVQHQGNVEFVSGGIGIDESTSMKQAEKNYPLSMVFTQHMQGENAYTADVPVTITNASGTTVLQTTTRGPYLLVKLPPGEYTVRSVYNGTELTRRASVGGPGSARLMFEWK